MTLSLSSEYRRQRIVFSVEDGLWLCPSLGLGPLPLTALQAAIDRKLASNVEPLPQASSALAGACPPPCAPAGQPIPPGKAGGECSQREPGRCAPPAV